MEELTLSLDIQQLLTAEQAWHYRIVPVENQDDGSLLCWVSDDEDLSSLTDELELILGRVVLLKPVASDQIKRYLNQYYRKSDAALSDAVAFNTGNEHFLLKLLLEGKSLGASDIHIEVYQEIARLRLRIDGVLMERYRLKKTDYPALVNKIKIKANLDISEKRLPQDGRINVEDGGRKFDIRVSVLPTLYGEKIVMRYLGNDATHIDIKKLGFSEEQLEQYYKAIKRPNGIILISGPTGSGKTTTLYASLKLLNEEKRNIVTAEDPIEYTLDGINQVQLKESIGLNFAAALRTFLRQDPDIIMLGEIRDHETAEMAIRASLTGHLVLSTIHTNSAWGTVDRLMDMGVPSFLLASTLSMSIAQRLVRKLCEHCKTAEEFSLSSLPAPTRLFEESRVMTKHYLSVGCEHCYYTGYKGRIAIYEMIPVDHEMSELIKNRSEKIKQVLAERQIKTLGQQGLRLVQTGVSSLEEIYPLLLESI